MKCQQGVKGSLEVHGERLSSLLYKVSSILHTHLTSGFCMVVRGGHNSVYLNVTLAPSHLSTGHRCLNHVVGVKRNHQDEGQLVAQGVFHCRFISVVVKFISQLWILGFVSLQNSWYKVTPSGCAIKKKNRIHSAKYLASAEKTS